MDDSINSAGGGADEPISMYDTMKMMVCTIAMELATIFHSGRRTNINGLMMEAEDMLELRNTIADIYAKNTDQPINVIQKDLERDYFMPFKRRNKNDN